MTLQEIMRDALSEMINSFIDVDDAVPASTKVHQKTVSPLTKETPHRWVEIPHTVVAVSTGRGNDDHFSLFTGLCSWVTVMEIL